eukprot:scaffold1491_cov286-Prasinococcus_capsulatus_cf.AAC.1
MTLGILGGLRPLCPQLLVSWIRRLSRRTHPCMPDEPNCRSRRRPMPSAPGAPATRNHSPVTVRSLGSAPSQPAPSRRALPRRLAAQPSAHSKATPEGVRGVAQPPTPANLTQRNATQRNAMQCNAPQRDARRAADEIPLSAPARAGPIQFQNTSSRPFAGRARPRRATTGGGERGGG